MVHLVLVAPVEDLGQALEGVIDVAALEGAHFEELETDRLSECKAILWAHSYPRLEVNLVSDDHSHERSALVLLLDAL